MTIALIPFFLAGIGILLAILFLAVVPLGDWLETRVGPRFAALAIIAILLLTVASCAYYYFLESLAPHRLTAKQPQQENHMDYMECMGHPVSYWLELQKRVDSDPRRLEVEQLLTEVIDLRAKVNFYESRIAQMAEIARRGEKQ